MTFNVRIEDIKSKITKNKSIYDSRPKRTAYKYDDFVELSKSTGIPFIADSAESFGSTYKGSW